MSGGGGGGGSLGGWCGHVFLLRRPLCGSTHWAGCRFGARSRPCSCGPRCCGCWRGRQRPSGLRQARAAANREQRLCSGWARAMRPTSAGSTCPCMARFPAACRAPAATTTAAPEWGSACASGATCPSRSPCSSATTTRPTSPRRRETSGTSRRPLPTTSPRCRLAAAAARSKTRCCPGRLCSCTALQRQLALGQGREAVAGLFPGDAPGGARARAAVRRGRARPARPRVGVAAPVAAQLGERRHESPDDVLLPRPDDGPRSGVRRAQAVGRPPRPRALCGLGVLLLRLARGAGDARPVRRADVHLVLAPHLALRAEPGRPPGFGQGAAAGEDVCRRRDGHGRAGERRWGQGRAKVTVQEGARGGLGRQVDALVAHAAALRRHHARRAAVGQRPGHRGRGRVLRDGQRVGAGPRTWVCAGHGRCRHPH